MSWTPSPSLETFSSPKQPAECRHLLLGLLLWPLLKHQCVGWNGMKWYKVKINFDPSNSVVVSTFPGLSYLHSLNSSTECEPQLLPPKLLLSAQALPFPQTPPVLDQQCPRTISFRILSTQISSRAYLNWSLPRPSLSYLSPAPQQFPSHLQTPSHPSQCANTTPTLVQEHRAELCFRLRREPLSPLTALLLHMLLSLPWSSNSPQTQAEPVPACLGPFHTQPQFNAFNYPNLMP